MIMEDLLAVIGEDTTVRVYDANTGEHIAIYDGKNSIDAGLNMCAVCRVGAAPGGELLIDIYRD